jgi:hypothetical protein
VGELGTFMPEYNPLQVGIFNDLYNCKAQYKDRIRGGVAKGHTVNIENPHLSLLLGVQPERLSDTFPEQVFQAGFFSRTVLIYADPPLPVAIHNSKKAPANKQLWNKIVSDIRQLTNLVGEFQLDPEVKEALDYFHTVEAKKTEIEHYKFKTYNTRRTLHLHKLCMAVSASSTSSMRITMKHFERARRYLLDAEAEAPRSFSNLIHERGFHGTVEEITAGKSGKIISQREVERTLRKRYKAYEIPHIVKSMLTSGELRELPEADRFGLKQYVINRGE